MDLYDKIVNRKEKLSLVGLGYVGLPIAVAFSKKVDVIGFDINDKKIETYISGKGLPRRQATTPSRSAVWISRATKLD